MMRSFWVSALLLISLYSVTIGTEAQGGDVSSILSRSLFEQMLKHRNDAACPGKGFYTHDGFIAAAKAFPRFGMTGDIETRKREIAAFFAQTSHETTGGWPTAPDGPSSWGYCLVEERNKSNNYCDPKSGWPCAPGKKYYGRGPMQISHNYNYGQTGKALNLDLIKNPDAVARDQVLSFKTALWFWMTPQSPKPSCHAVITRQWRPRAVDSKAGRIPGFGLLTNIINGKFECGQGHNSAVEDRIGFYKRYCSMLGIGYGNNLDCYNQKPYA